jgi:hypothetical protein
VEARFFALENRGSKQDFTPEKKGFAVRLKATQGNSDDDYHNPGSLPP